MSLLQQSRVQFAAAQVDKLRALACGALLGLTRDQAIQQMLTKLQVCGWARLGWSVGGGRCFVTGWARCRQGLLSGVGQGSICWHTTPRQQHPHPANAVPVVAASR
jgi:hypothetical protein